MLPFPYISKELLDIILEYDGRIKYKKGKYINILHKNDIRYNIITPVIIKKIEIKKHILQLQKENGPGFYFEFGFDIDYKIGLCYDYNYSVSNKFEICYFDFRDGIIQKRTYL